MQLPSHFTLQSASAESGKYRLFYQGIVAVSSVKFERHLWKQRGLRHKARRLATVWLRGMHQKRMTQVYRPSPAQRQSFLHSLSRRGRGDSQFQTRHAFFSAGRQ